MSIEEKRQAAVDVFLTFNFSHQDHFDAGMLRLMQKADRRNKGLLRQVYPYLMDALLEWNATANQVEFFEKYQIADILFGDEAKFYAEWRKRETARRLSDPCPDCSGGGTVRYAGRPISCRACDGSGRKKPIDDDA